jgi:predicted MFS family arabinose efflux permease
LIRTVLRAYRAAFSGLPRELWLLAVVALVNRAGSMVLPFVSLYLTQQRGFSVLLAGQTLGLYGMGAIIGSNLGGWLTDRIGPTRCQQLSLLASGAGYLVFSMLRDLNAILAATLALAVVVESFRPANMAGFAQRAPRQAQVRAFGLLRLAANLGMGIGPAVGGLLALHDYAWLFYVDAATCWLAAALMAAMLRPISRAAPDREEPGLLSSRSPWRDGPFLAFLLLVSMLAMVFFQIMSTLPLYWKAAYGYREDAIGLLFAANATIIVLFEMVLTYWAERRRRMVVVGIGSFLVCLGFGLMPLGSSMPFVLLTVLVWTFGEMLALPMMNAVVAARSGAGNRGRYMGMMTMAFAIAFMVAPLAGTWIYDRWGAETLWFGVGVLGLPLLFGALALARPLAAGGPDWRIQGENSQKTPK